MNGVRTSRAKWLIAAALALLALFAGWRVFRAANAPNLLGSAGFGGGNLDGWSVLGSPNSAVAPESGGEQAAVRLSLAGTDGQNWAGLARRVPVAAGQNYRAAAAYRRAGDSAGGSTVLLRVSQFDGNGNLLDSAEIPAPLDTAGPGQQTVEHTFAAHPTAAEMEIGVGLFGPQAVAVTLNDVSLVETQPWPDILWRDGWLVAALVTLLALAAAWPLRGAIAVRRRALALAAVNILLLLLFAEIAALGIYLIRDGRFFYANPPEPLAAPAANRTGDELTTFRIHPYFGYASKVGLEHDPESIWGSIGADRRTANNHGFFSEVDYPFARTGSNQFIIGVFGGSVAEQFALIGRDSFVEALKSNPALAGKEVVVLNFAKAGYKQPQQLLILNYFLSLGQPLDLVINLDGFNEVALGYRNFEAGIDWTMPHRGYFNDLAQLVDQSALTPQKLDSLAAIGRAQRGLNRLAELHNRTGLAAVAFVTERLFNVWQNRYTHEIENYGRLTTGASETSLLFVKPNGGPPDAAAQMEQMAQNWADSSLLMADALRARHIPYLHVLQPNQYFSGKKFTPEELNTAVLPDHPRFYDVSAAQGYPLLLQKADTLKQSGVHFFDATPIFDNVQETIYRDNCCHFNLPGNRLLARFVARAVTESGVAAGESK